MSLSRLARYACSGIIVGAGTGSLTAVADFARSLLGLGNHLPTAAFLDAAVWYVAVWAACGLVIGTVLGLLLEHGARWTALLLIAGSAYFLVAILVNIELLPGFTDPLSLGTDLAILGATGLLLLLLDRQVRHPGNPRFWGGVTVAVLVGTFVVVKLSPPAGGPLPEAIPTSDDRHPSVLLLVVDSLRADHTSLGGYERTTTPNLGRFATEAMIYGRARSTCSWTKPSATTILTGLPPGVHGVESDPDLVPSAAISVAEVLSAGGYATGLFSDNHYVSEYFGLGQGFDRVIDPLTGRGLGRIGLPPSSLLGHAAIGTLVKMFRGFTPETDPARGGLVTDLLWWLDDQEPGRPWFAYVHFMEPHYPYQPPKRFLERFTVSKAPVIYPPNLDVGLAPFRAGDKVTEVERQHMIDAYDGEILRWDDRFRHLLEDLDSRGRLEDLIVVVTADHGEAFHDHLTWGHGDLYEELIHVPLMIRGPGVEPGRHEGAVTLAGLPAAIVGLAGFEPPPEMVEWTEPVYPVPAGDQISHSRTIRDERFMLSEVDGPRKWFYSRWRDREALLWFDLADDPGETTDLAPFRIESSRQAIAALLARWMEEGQKSLSGEDPELSSRVEEALRGLGYVK